LLEYQNFLQHCTLFLRFQQKYFESPIKLFSDLYIQQNFKSFSKTVLSVYANLKIILLDHRNNYVGWSSWWNVKTFCSITLLCL